MSLETERERLVHQLADLELNHAATRTAAEFQFISQDDEMEIGLGRGDGEGLG